MLYNLTEGLHVINAMLIGNDGSLTTVATSTVLPAGTIGIVAS